MERIPLNLYDLTALSIDGTEVALSQFCGQVLLIVNTASNCGFTPQYTGLEALYKRFRDRGLIILGFPSNQFGAQEPGSEAEIAQFCELNYGVTFPIFSKVEVNGPQAHPLFRLLKREQGGIFGSVGFNSIKWNFTKFLVDREGRVVARFAPTRTPSELTGAIEKLL